MQVGVSNQYFRASLFVRVKSPPTVCAMDVLGVGARELATPLVPSAQPAGSHQQGVSLGCKCSKKWLIVGVNLQPS